MSLGHIIGTLSEPITKGICLATNIKNKEVVCSALSIGVHEFVIEPAVDSILYTSISSLNSEGSIFHNFNFYRFTTQAITSIVTSKVGEHYYGEESILISCVFGFGGSYAGGYLYDSINPSDPLHGEL